MTDELLQYVIPSTANTAEIDVNAVLTISDTANTDGSYTVTAISGTRGNDSITGLAPTGTAGSDNEIFLSGNIVDGAGITYVTTGSPNAAGPTTTNSADVNFFRSSNTNFYAEDTTPNATVVTNVSLSPACFGHGTLLLTTRGEVAVQNLCENDMVLTASGEQRQIKWIGHRITNCLRHPRPQDVYPVRVSAGAFGAGVPRRDLVLSPDHSVYIDSVLIPVRYLLNGATIVQNFTETIIYWHIELDSHDLLMAEGMPCESYLDTGNRTAFSNGGESMQVHPDFALQIWAVRACCKLVCNGAELEAARSFLRCRAVTLGNRLTRDPAIQVKLGGSSLTPSLGESGYRIILPTNSGHIQIRSRCAVPAHIHDMADDHRCLGVAISRISLDGQPLDWNDDRIVTGWHDIEYERGLCWRWTDGDAHLAVGGAHTLEFDVIMTGEYWVNSIDAKSQAPIAA
jgi:hypothetical protein